MLGKEVLAVNDFWIIRTTSVSICNIIAQLVQRLHDDTEGISLVMAFQVLYILEYENSWLFCGNNTRHIKKQRSLCFTFKTMCLAKGVFL